MLAGRYWLTILMITIAGGLLGTLIGAAYGYAGHEPGWWGVGLLLGLIYGTIGGFSAADRA